MPASSQKRRSRRWSLQAAFDVPTFVHVLRYGVLFYTGRLTAMADPCCQSLAAAQARFPESQGGWRGDGALTSLTATRLGSARKHVTFNGSAGWRYSRPMSSYWGQAWSASAPPCTCSSEDGMSSWSTGTNSRARRPVLEMAA